MKTILHQQSNVDSFRISIAVQLAVTDNVVAFLTRLALCIGDYNCELIKLM